MIIIRCNEYHKLITVRSVQIDRVTRRTVNGWELAIVESSGFYLTFKIECTVVAEDLIRIDVVIIPQTHGVTTDIIGTVFDAVGVMDAFVRISRTALSASDIRTVRNLSFRTSGVTAVWAGRSPFMSTIVVIGFVELSESVSLSSHTPLTLTTTPASAAFFTAFSIVKSGSSTDFAVI
jgi:hypothetical protein